MAVKAERQRDRHCKRRCKEAARRQGADQRGLPKSSSSTIAHAGAGQQREVAKARAREHTWPVTAAQTLGEQSNEGLGKWASGNFATNTSADKWRIAQVGEGMRSGRYETAAVIGPRLQELSCNKRLARCGVTSRSEIGRPSPRSAQTAIRSPWPNGYGL